MPPVVPRHAGQVVHPEERSRHLTDAELQKLLDHRAENPRQVTIPMIHITLFATATAMRLGEIVSLEWGDLDGTNRTIRIRTCKHPTKRRGTTSILPSSPLPYRGRKLIEPLGIMLRQKQVA